MFLQALEMQRIPQAGGRLGAALVESGVARRDSDDRSVEEENKSGFRIGSSLASQGKVVMPVTLLYWPGGTFVYAPLINVEVDLAKLEVVLHISGARTHGDTPLSQRCSSGTN
jgi:hypothetical protein